MLTYKVKVLRTFVNKETQEVHFEGESFETPNKSRVKALQKRGILSDHVEEHGEKEPVKKTPKPRKKTTTKKKSPKKQGE